MSFQVVMTVVAGCLVLPFVASAQNVEARLRQHLDEYTLDQPGTHPFHLKAELGPSLERDRASGRTGEVEIWWQSPTRWRREVRCESFRQIEIVDGSRDWQKNEGEVFPEWLREMAIALVKPVPDVDAALVRLKTAEVRQIGPGTHISWVEMGSDGSASKGIGQGIDLDNDGPLFAMSVGASASLHDPVNFHGRQVATKVRGGFGSPEIEAHVTTIEDLKSMPADPTGPSDPILKTVVMKELDERGKLLPEVFAGWPAMTLGPTDGAMLFEVVIDRTGKVAEIGGYLSDNPGLRATAEERLHAMRFKPTLRDGVPVQVVTTITMGFKTTRPPGVENFPPSKEILDKARKLSFPSAGGTSPYVLKAEFTTRSTTGEITKGTYTDTWLSDTQWRREAVFGKSRLVRSRNGEKRYLLAEGPDAGLLRLLFEVIEPIPDTESWFEPEWLVKHDSVDGIAALRVSRGRESADGILESQAQAYWLDEDGRLIKTHEKGIETRRTLPNEFAGLQIARRVDLMSQGKLALRLDVTDLSDAGVVDPSMFIVKGHEWVRQFTPEVR